MRRSKLVLSRKFLIGILIWIAVVVPQSESLRGSALVLQAKTKLAESKQQTEEESNNGTSTSNTTITKPLLTGIPQIDYIHDPNLPRELNGHNLTDYPFYNAVPMPEQIDFKCDGLHDGFYASVPHKCQVYHHCLFGTRYDFLCANYTAFDQKTFICHFVSEVDCGNSPKYYKRNEALYKEASTTSTSTTTTSTPSTTTANAHPVSNRAAARHGSAGRRRRPFRRRRPAYEYYYNDEEYVESDYYDDDETASLSDSRNPTGRRNKDNYSENRKFEPDYESPNEQVKPVVRPSSGISIYERPRLPPKIRRPIPKSERDKYELVLKSSITSTTTTETHQSTTSPKPKQQTTPAPEDDYYDAEEEYDYEETKSAKAKHHKDYDVPKGSEDARRYISRHRSRANIYENYDTKTRPRMKEYTRYESPHNGDSGMFRGNKNRPEEPPAEGYKKRVTDGEHRPPVVDYDYYHDGEGEEPSSPKRDRRPVETPKPHKQSETTTEYQKPNILDYETIEESEIPTTEKVSSRASPKYPTIKIVDNLLKGESDEGIDYASREKTKTYHTHTRPFAGEQLRKKTVTQMRHFAIPTPIRNLSHLGIFNTTAKGEDKKIPYFLERKPQEYYTPDQHVKIPLKPRNRNHTTYQGLAFTKYFVLMEPKRKFKPVEEHLNENSNVIFDDINYNAFVPEHKPFDVPKPRTYLREHRPYLDNGRLFTNSITFPHTEPLEYDIQTPGPSAAGEESTSSKKYTDLPNKGYDVIYNDAPQPVRQFPSPSLYVHSQPRIISSGYVFDKSALNAINRFQNRDK